MSLTLRPALTACAAPTTAPAPSASQEGGLDLPELSPGDGWSGRLEWPAPGAAYRIELSLVRPTGFAVLARRYGVRGVP